MQGSLYFTSIRYQILLGAGYMEVNKVGMVPVLMELTV